MAKNGLTTKPDGGLINWEKELADEAAIVGEMESSTATGQFFSIKSGVLSFNDAPMPDNQVAVVILDGILENVYYKDAYDPENPAGPTCFAFGRDEAKMAPHQLVVDAGNAQHDKCAGCPMNEWGTAEKGRGKACRNIRRLAMISAGTFDKAGNFVPVGDAAHYSSSQIALMKLPVTSVKGYAAFVKAIVGTLKKPPFAIATRIKVVPDAKSQFKLQFAFKELINFDQALWDAMKKKTADCAKEIVAPYPHQADLDAAKAAEAPKTKSKAPAKAVPMKPVGKVAQAAVGKAKPPIGKPGAKAAKY